MWPVLNRTEPTVLIGGNRVLSRKVTSNLKRQNFCDFVSPGIRTLTSYRQTKQEVFEFLFCLNNRKIEQDTFWIQFSPNWDELHRLIESLRNIFTSLKSHQNCPGVSFHNQLRFGQSKLSFHSVRCEIYNSYSLHYSNKHVTKATEIWESFRVTERQSEYETKELISWNTKLSNNYSLRLNLNEINL